MFEDQRGVCERGGGPQPVHGTENCYSVIPVRAAATPAGIDAQTFAFALNPSKAQQMFFIHLYNRQY